VAVFAGLVNQAKVAASGLLLKYLARASVAIPFVVALGFALAAMTLMLVERFGHVAAYWTMAGGLAVIGLIAGFAVSIKEHEEKLAEPKAEAGNSQHLMSDATAQAIAQGPLAILGALFATPGGTTTALKAARIIGRNWPLALLLVVIGVLIWPTEDDGAIAESAEPARTPDGSHPDGTYH
jgi:hypothetical protein